MSEQKKIISAYAKVNGLNMYYEIHGEGKPLVLIHGGGSTILSFFSKIIPLFALHRRVIAMELQAHGRTSDRDAELSFEQDADDVITLMKQLDIPKADILGFSNGGKTLIEICLRHPEMVNKAIIASTYYQRKAAIPLFWNVFEDNTFELMPQDIKDEFLKVNNDEAALKNMLNKVWRLMKAFNGWSDEQMRMIKAPTMVISGNNDVGSVEHTVEMYRTILYAELIILPGGRDDYLIEGEKPLVVGLIEAFLNR